MKNNYKLVKKFTNDVTSLQNKIEHKNLYNVRNFIVKLLLKSGITIDYALPFIFSFITAANLGSSKNNTPFYLDEKPLKTYIETETIDTSSGIHLEHVSVDFNYDKELIEHSTGWIVNDKGLYERTVTSYRLNNKIDLNNVEEIMSMTKEEIEEILIITNIKTIQKNILTPEDSIYKSDAIIVVNHSVYYDESFMRLETAEENFWNSVIYIIFALSSGYGYKSIEGFFIKTHVRDKLKKYVPLFKYITKEELETMKKILKVKQENLMLITEESKEKTYRLRKK